MKNTILYHIRENRKKYLLVIILFLFGMIAGMLIEKYLPQAYKKELFRFLNSFFCVLQDKNLDRRLIFRDHFLRELKIYMVLWTVGLMRFSGIFTLGYVFLRGVFLSFTTASVISFYADKGLLYCIICVLPQNLIKIAALFFVCVCIISYRNRKEESLKFPYRKRSTARSYIDVYTALIGVAFLLSVAGVWIESYFVTKIIFLFAKNMV